MPTSDSSPSNPFGYVCAYPDPNKSILGPFLCVLEAFSAIPSMHYDESSITIIDSNEAIDRFDYELKADLARRYPASHPDFIGRLIDACRIAGEPVEPAVARYLAKDQSAPQPSPELMAVFAEQLAARRA